MSSDKMRMRIRLFRLQEISKSLGREPNAKDYEIKSLVNDFDKVARKQIARLKKGKYQKLNTRGQIIVTYGLKSRERISKSPVLETLTSDSNRRRNQLNDKDVRSRLEEIKGNPSDLLGEGARLTAL